jgi:hypothetical protein
MLHTTFVERVVLEPGLVDFGPVVRQTGFALFLFDAFTRRNALVGLYDQSREEQADQDHARRTGDASLLAAHTTVRLAGRDTVPSRKPPAAAFLFFLELPAGQHTIEVRSPYYQPRDLVVTLPFPSATWPAFPDVTLADEDLPLDSAAQPAAYRAQRLDATLVPGRRYPFPPTATLVRGTVRSGGQPLAGATVRRTGDALASVTDATGEYVLFFDDVPGVGAVVTLDATHPQHAAVASQVQMFRGMTALRDIAMA